MSVSADAGRGANAKADHSIAERFDAVVMLTWSNWNTEMRSNRYHYASRLARELPVLFVQADLMEPEARFEQTELRNVEVLHVPARYGRTQTRILERALRARRIRRPLLWVYNVYFIDAISRATPALLVYHATEDFFNRDFFVNPGAEELQTLLRNVLAQSDVVVAVSEGVRESYVLRGGYDGPMIVATNGCDFSFWGVRPEEVADGAGRGISNIAIYQGGLSHKVDFKLMAAVVASMPDWEFWFAGDEVNETEQWEIVKRLPNVRYFGVLGPEQIRDLVHRATVGLIPFQQNDLIIERSWPLKAFEYVASGLPVVTVPILSLRQFPSVFTFATNASEFAEAIRRLAPTRLDPSALSERLRVAAGQDYDLRFAAVRAELGRVRPRRPRRRSFGARLEAVFDDLPGGSTRARIVGILTRSWEVLTELKGAVTSAPRLPRLAIKLIATFLLTTTAPRLRTLLWRYLTNERARAWVSLDSLLSDLMRLGVLSSYAGRENRRSSLRTILAYSRRDGVLEFRTAPKTGRRLEETAPTATASIRRLIWDCSALAGNSREPLRLRHRQMPVSLRFPADARWEFTAINALLAWDPALVRSSVWPLIVPEFDPTPLRPIEPAPTGVRPLSILMFCDDNAGHANAVLDHIAGLVAHSSSRISVFNPTGLDDSPLLDLNEFDVVVLHWSLLITSDDSLAPALRDKIARFGGLKVQFVQDDYRSVDKFAEVMRRLGIQVLFTLVPEISVTKVWGDRLPGVRIETTLAGYVPDSLVEVVPPPIESRSIDVGYRGRILPFHLGRVSQEKVWIGQGVLARASEFNLRCDIAWRESDRIYGEGWNSFIRSCRTMLGTESGATIFDFDGSIERRVQDYLALHPSADFFEVERSVLGPYENNVRMTVVSPRVFEAVAWRTALIQFPGEYSGVIRPWDHYIPLERDFSNFAEVVARIRDTGFLEELTERAYGDLIASGRYTMRTFVRRFDAIVAEEAARRRASVPGFASHVGPRRRLHIRFLLARVEAPLRSPFAFATRRFGESRVRPIASAVKGLAAIALVARTRELRRIFRLWLRNAKVRSAVRPSLLLRDLLKVGIVRQSQRGALDGEPFVVIARLEADRLLMSSQRLGVPRPDDFGWKAVEPALRSGQVRHILWDHSPVGFNARYRLPLGGPVAVGGEGGRNALTGLDAVLAVEPSMVADALRPPTPAEVPEWLRPAAQPLQ